MKSSDEIFQLIKSLTKQEKRYFNLYANRHVIGEKNDYLQLFEVINKRDQYDEEEIKKELKKELLIKNFRIVKNHLYQHIISSLHSYHANSTHESNLQKHIHAIEILYHKGLFKQAEKILKKIKPVAYQYEKYSKLLDILAWEKKLIVATSYSDITLFDLQHIHDEEKNILLKIGMINTYWHQSHHTFLLLNKKGVARGEDELFPFPSVADNNEHFTDNKEIPYHAKLFNYHLKGVYYYSKGDLNISYKYRKEIVQLMELHPEQIKETPKNYLVSLQDLLIVCSKLGKTDEFNSLLKKLRNFATSSIAAKSIDIQIKIFISSYILEMDMYLRTGEFTKGILLINGIEEKLKQHENKINTNEKLAMYANIACLYFGIENYKKTLFWLNKIFNDVSTNLREDIYADAKIIYLIVQYELGNMDTLKYFTKGSYHFFTKKERLYKFEHIVLDFFKTLSKIKTQEKVVIYFKKVKKDIQSITKNPYEKKVLEYFDFISWLDSKIEARPFAEVVRGKVGSKQ